MYNAEQILQKIWLNKNEQRIFLACMEYGGLTVTWIQRKITIPRTTIYDTLQKLELKWYITKSKRKHTLTFYTVSIQELVALTQDTIYKEEQKKKLLQEHISVFQTRMKWTDIVPEVKIYQWKEALSIIYHQVKQTSTIRTIFTLEVAREFLSEETIQDVHWTHKENKAHKKILLAHSQEAQQEIKTLQEKWFEVKILLSTFPTHADIMIMDHKVLFVSYGEIIQALEITQPLFVQAQRSMFESIRQNTP
jgi:sugar-specific transcriptional regulator TrmB